MKVNGIPTRTIRALDNGSAIEIIDQTLLPYRFEKRILSDWRDGVEAIETMRVRGAPLIGIAGAWSVVLAVKENPENGPLLAAAERIQCARPTAVNLVWAVQKMLTALLPREPSQRFDTAVKLAAQLTQEDVDTCRAIGDMGCSLIAERYQALRRPVNILTHCNAGWLATVDYGTALAPIYAAFERGTPLHVWVDETRPRNQGLLTAWELRQQGVPHTIIADNAGGQLMQKGDVDLVIVGADRITRRGDVANKIGHTSRRLLLLTMTSRFLWQHLRQPLTGSSMTVSVKFQLKIARQPRCSLFAVLTKRGTMHLCSLRPLMRRQLIRHLM